MRNVKLNVPQEVNEILDAVKAEGFEIFIVGGAVRDVVMGKAATDWDFATNATPGEIIRVFPEGFYDNRFGTVGVKGEGTEKPFEITTYRTEMGYDDARRPSEVKWGKTIDEDLVRRDFTINAMALTKKKNGEYELIDMFGGLTDLKSKTIRAVGEPRERIGEDALRMMRAVRLAAELGFVIESHTFEAIVENVEKILRISWERIRDELFKILKTEYVYDGLIILKNCGILELILPEATAGFGVEQASVGRHHIYDVGMHSFLATRFCPSYDPVVRLATLLHDCGKVATWKRLPSGTITFYNHEVVGTQIAYLAGKRLRLSKEQLKKLTTLVRWHQFSVDERQTDSAIRRFIRRVGKENINDMLALRTGDRLGGGARETSWRLEKYKERIEQLLVTPFTIADMAVDGHDVMKILGIKPGPMIGEVLGSLFDEVMEDHEKNERQYLLKRIEKFGSSNSR